MKEWCVGILITLIILRILGFKAEGIVAIIFLTVIPYFVGMVALQLMGVKC
jgi:hypothetical protein